jgi:hypothetical protein
LSQSAITNFREHWLFDCVENSIDASSIHHFLKLAIGARLLKVVREVSTQVSVLISWANEMVGGLLQHMATFPNDMRVLLAPFLSSSFSIETKGAKRLEDEACSREKEGSVGVANENE